MHAAVTYIILYINYTSIKNKMTTSPEKQYSLMLWEVFVIKCEITNYHHHCFLELIKNCFPYFFNTKIIAAG